METPAERCRVVRFGVFEADLQGGELRKSGVKLRLSGQPFQVLITLLDKPGQVVTRDELRKKLWDSDTFVDFEHSLGTAINKIRDALDDSADNPRFIETIPRRGYRFLADVEAVQTPFARPAMRRQNRWRPAAGLAMVAGAALLLGLNAAKLRMRIFAKSHTLEIRSIALLPLENMSKDPSQDYFSDGMTDALTTELAQIGSLRVISRTSAMHFKGTRQTLPQIGQELKVDAVVEGSALRAGDRIRITAQLIETQTDRHLWAKSYERSAQDVLALQDEVARDIAQEIRIKLTPQERVQLSSARPVSPDVYELYLRGRFFLNQRTPDGMRNAVAQFTEAVERDDGYALAYAGLSDSYSLLHYYYAKPRMEVIAQQKAAALKAVALDDSLAETHTSLAQTFVDEWSWPEAEKEFQRAIELNPNYSLAHLWYSWLLQYQDRLAEAASEAQRALNLDPLGVVSNANLGYIYAEQRGYDRAINQLEKSSNLNPDYADPHVELANVFF